MFGDCKVIVEKKLITYTKNDYAYDNNVII